MPHSPVFYEDGRVQDGCLLTPQQALIKHGSGIYTTALITPEGMVVDWVLHRKRLLRGIELFNTRSTRPFQPLLSALEAQGSSLPDFFDHRVVSAMKAALAVFYDATSRSTAQQTLAQPPRPLQPQSLSEGPLQSQPQSQPQSLSEGPLQPQPQSQPQSLSEEPPNQPHAMLVVCISPPADHGNLTEAAAAAATASAASRPCTESGGGAAAGGGGGGGGHQSAVEGRDHSGASCDLPVSITVYCKEVQPPPYGPHHAVQAAVMGRPRDLPGAKASSWVQERRRYEDNKPPEAAEVLLADAGGRILEGLTTNFYVVTVATDNGATAHGAAAATAGVLPAAAAAAGTLHACGPEADAALPGVVQTRVLEAAQRLGMRLVLEPPAASERGEWSEAFISNCIQRIQPLSRVFCPLGNAWGADPWDCQLPQPAGPHTSALLRALLRLEERTPWRDL